MDRRVELGGDKGEGDVVPGADDAIEAGCERAAGLAQIVFGT